MKSILLNQTVWTVASAVALSLIFATPADARSARRDQVPNGRDANTNCGTCHMSTDRGDARNAFGVEVFLNFLNPQNASGVVQWSPALAALDSDGDGYTNGEELGDPDGTWTTADPVNTAFEATSPGNAASTPCGNGTLEGPEACDGGALGGATCASEGFDTGEIACNLDCTLDTSRCTDVVCGDNVAEGSELCDGTDLAGTTCEDRGFNAGTLACAVGCFFDDSGCFNTTCGDDVAEGAEACDGADLLDATCESLGFVGGGTLACDGACGFDTSLCEGERLPVCGDGIVEGDEVCDTTLDDAITCLSEGFDEGTIACGDDCQIDVSLCVAFDCGNGIVEGDEECDGSVPEGASCEDFGFTRGELRCFDDCTLSPIDCDRDLPGEDVSLADDVAEPMPDAGTPDAGGTDAGGSDAGGSDAGGSDAGTTEPDTDGTPLADVGGTDDDDKGSDGGCAAAPGNGSAWGLALIGLALLRRRRNA